jgi:hypothetical protein
MEIQTSQPVRWKIRGALSRKDMKMVLKAMLKLSILSFLLSLKAWFKGPAHPGDY